MADEVRFFAGPWVSGAAATYWGPVKVERFVPDTALEQREQAWERGASALFAEIEAEVVRLGGNAVVSFELTADPWADGGGIALSATGTAAKLEPIYPGVEF